MVFWVLAFILCKLTTLNDQWSFSAQFWLWFCPILYRLNCLEDSLSGQGAFTARLDTLERSAANCDERILDVLSRMESFCPDNVSVNNRRAFPSNRGPRGRGRPHIVSSSDRRFESKSREFNVPRKRGSESFRSSNRDGPSRHYWKDFSCLWSLWNDHFLSLRIILIFRLANSILVHNHLQCMILFVSCSFIRLQDYIIIASCSLLHIFLSLLRCPFSFTMFMTSNHPTLCCYPIFVSRFILSQSLFFCSWIQFIPRYLLLRCLFHVTVSPFNPVAVIRLCLLLFVSSWSFDAPWPVSPHSMRWKCLDPKK